MEERFLTKTLHFDTRSDNIYKLLTLQTNVLRHLQSLSLHFVLHISEYF